MPKTKRRYVRKRPSVSALAAALKEQGKRLDDHGTRLDNHRDRIEDLEGFRSELRSFAERLREDVTAPIGRLSNSYRALSRLMVAMADKAEIPVPEKLRSSVARVEPEEDE